MQTDLESLEITVFVGELQLGMFVSDVSCGWRNTPFMLEGLLISSPGEILVLKRFAEHVTVDISRSDDVVAKALRLRMQSMASDAMYAQRRADAEPAYIAYRLADAQQEASADRSNKARNGWWQELRDWLQARSRSPEYHAPLLTGKRPEFIPEDIDLYAYQEPVFQPAAVPIAVTACQATLTLLEDVADRIAQNKLISAASLEGASKMMAEHIVAHPGAILWASKALVSNEELYLRSLEVGIFLAVLGRQLGLPKELLAELTMAGFVLDLGKTKVDPALLHKTEPLSADETQAMQMHVLHTLDMLSHVKDLPQSVVCAVVEHHERMDGEGYPNRLQGAEISIYGKMAAIIDSYVAMTNPRSYAQTLSPHEAFRELFKGAQSHWHEPLVEQFVQAIGIFPPGTLVELSDGRLAIIMQDFRLRRLEPTVLIVSDSSKEKLSCPMQIDLWRHNIEHEDSKLLITRGLADGSHGVHLEDYYFGKP